MFSTLLLLTPTGESCGTGAESSQSNLKYSTHTTLSAIAIE